MTMMQPTFGAMPWPLLPPGSSWPPPPGVVPGRIVRVGPRQYRATDAQRTRAGFGAYGWSPLSLLTWPGQAGAQAYSELVDRNAAVTEIDRAKKQQPLPGGVAGATSAATMSQTAKTPAAAYFRAAWWLAVAVRMGAPSALLSTADGLMQSGLRALVPNPANALPHLWSSPGEDAAREAYRAAYTVAANTPGVPTAVTSALKAGSTGGTPWLWIGLGISAAGLVILGLGVQASRRKA